MQTPRFVFLFLVFTVSGLWFKFHVTALSEQDCLELAGAEHAFQLDSKHVDLDKLVECLRVVNYDVLSRTVINYNL